jgi:hypothetical protein
VCAHGPRRNLTESGRAARFVTVSSVCEKVSLISLLTLYKMSFLFDLIFKKVITVLKVYNLVDFLLIMFFIVIIVVSLNLYKRLR